MKKLVLALTAFMAVASVFADYATSGTFEYKSTADDPSVFLGETPQGPYTWTHDGNFFMFAGGLIPSLDAVKDVTPAKLTLKDATVTVKKDFAVASGGTVGGEPVGGSGELTLDHTTMNVSGAFSIDNQNVLGGNKPSNPVLGKLTLKNGSKLSVGSSFNISANAAKGAEWNASVTNTLTLSGDSELNLASDIKRYDGPSGEVLFDGGRIVMRGSSGFFGAYGYGYDGKSALVIRSTPGNDIVLVNSYTNHLFSSQNTGYLLADGAIDKSGRGVLFFTGPSSNSGWVERLAFDGLHIREGEVLLYNNFTFRDPAVFPQYRRGTVEIDAGARLNINDNDAFLEDFTGAGTIHASVAANLTICNGSDIRSTVKLGRGLRNVVKRESTLAEVVPFGLDAESLAVNGGTLKFVDSPMGSRGYTHYRFRVLKVNDEGQPNQIMELREVKLFEGDADVTYVAGFRYDATTTHKESGGTGIFGNNELPEKAIDMDLNTKWCDLRIAEQDCWWIEFVYPTPVQVTAYNWAKTDNQYRSPREWVLEGSEDGESWTELSHERMDTRYLANNAWVSETPFATTLTDPRPAEKLGVLSVAPGATLDLSALSTEVEATPGVLHGAVVLPTGGRLVLSCESDVTVNADCFSGADATLVKTGAGKLTFRGSLPAGVSTEVLEGAIDFLPTGFSGKYFRFTVKDIRDTAKTGADKGKTMNLGKLHLFDANGTAVNENLAWRGGNPTGNTWQNPSDGTPASELEEGTFSQAAQYKYSIWNGAHEAPYWIFYPASDTHKWCTTEHAFDPNDSTTWYTVNFRIWDSAKPVVSYNLRTVGNQDREVSAWSLEGSVDGETWILLDEQSLGNAAPSAAHTWYNGGVPYAIDMSEADDDLPTIGRLTVDCAAETVGTIVKFNPSADGILDLVNVGETEIAGRPLPLAVTEVAPDAPEALRSWSVRVDGVASPKFRVVVKDGRLTVEKKSGFTVLVL